MEEIGRQASPSIPNAGAGAPPETLPEVSRRRPGAPKRKGAALLSSSTPSKRLAKERGNSHAHLFPVHHNGPVTRARQSPNKLAAAAAAAASVPQEQGAEAVKASAGKEIGGGAVDGEEFGLPEQQLVDVEFEAVRSRASKVHVVPTHAGWFSWEKMHPLEELAMSSFFDGKSENRSSDAYMDIRNSIVKKFHGNPEVHIEQKDLSEVSEGDSEARQEVLEFLDYWGLINFHPFPPSISDSHTAEIDEAAQVPSLTKKLYQFESIHRPSISRPKQVDSLVPAIMSPRPLPESSLSEDLVKPEEPSVEYHCNSCSGDCSRKRYHCQKQADFDLCSECYIAEKFGPGMAATDFILMESAEARGASTGSWTDQETLLLLEALELYGENWSEIAEHVATKTKAQCILHFVQMPIEDPFFEGNDDVDRASPGDVDPISTKQEPAASDVQETADSKSTEKENQPSASSPRETTENKDGTEAGITQENSSNIAIDALRIAFQSVSSLPEGELPSFADVGNPVMALAVFLAGMADPTAAITSTRSSMKAMCEDSPGIQLALRHCFPLEDPPNDNKDPAVSASDTVVNEDIIANGSDVTKKITSSDENSVQAELEKGSPPAEESSTTKDVKEPTDAASSVDAMPSIEESGNVSVREKELVHNPTTDPTVLDKQDEVVVSAGKESKNLPLRDEAKSDIAPNSKNEASSVSAEIKNSVKDPVADVNHRMDAHAPSTMGAIFISANGKEKEIPQASNSIAGVRDNTGEEDKKGGSEDNIEVKSDEADKNSGSVDTGDDNNLNRIKRAASTALSAAAVNANILAKREEDHIQELAAHMIDNQLRKLEIKLALFAEIEGVIVWVKEQLDKARKRLYQERAQIIAARFGFPASSSRQTATASQKPTVKQ